MVYPAAAQVRAQSSRVLVGPPACWFIKIRPFAPSTQQPWLVHPVGKPVADGDALELVLEIVTVDPVGAAVDEVMDEEDVVGSAVPLRT